MVPRGSPRDVSLSFFGEEKECLVGFNDTLEGLEIELLQGLEELVAPVEGGRFRDADRVGCRPDRHLSNHALDEGDPFLGIPCPAQRELSEIAEDLLAGRVFTAVSPPLLEVAEPYDIMAGAVRTDKAFGELGLSYAADEALRVDRLRVQKLLEGYEETLLVVLAELLQDGQYPVYSSLWVHAAPPLITVGLGRVIGMARTTLNFNSAKKIDLESLGSNRKETIDEIKIRLPKKAEGLQILRSASPRNTLVKKESAESLNSLMFRDPVVLQQHIYDLGQDTFGDLDLLLTGPYLPEQRFRLFVEIRDVFQKVS
jgi:hypothetical protein